MPLDPIFDSYVTAFLTTGFTTATHVSPTACIAESETENDSGGLSVVLVVEFVVFVVSFVFVDGVESSVPVESSPRQPAKLADSVPAAARKLRRFAEDIFPNLLLLAYVFC